MMKRFLGLGALLLLLAGCASDGPGEDQDFGNLLASPEALVLTEEEHPTGWGRPQEECFACHPVQNIHMVNRTGLPDDVVDLDNVRAIVANMGSDSCPLCHGDNGVEP
jgi:hypothetical protein